MKKHLDNKHHNKPYEPELKKYFEEQMFKNYCTDENRFTNQPSTITTITVPHYQKRSGPGGYDKFEEKRKQKVMLFLLIRKTLAGQLYGFGRSSAAATTTE